ADIAPATSAPIHVTPAKAGAQLDADTDCALAPGFRRDDVGNSNAPPKPGVISAQAGPQPSPRASGEMGPGLRRDDTYGCGTRITRRERPSPMHPNDRAARRRRESCAP